MKLSNSPSLFDKIFMQEALKQAKVALEKDEVPVGVVITKDNKIIARAHNQVETLKDPTAHCEMIAITQAASYLSSKWLNDCTLYVTLEPCSMCAGALVLARIKRVCFAAADPKTGGCGSVMNIAQNKMLNHRVDIDSGLLAAESSLLLKGFFQEKRIKGKKVG
jgi:tRNA(adenine34) deaminase